jgi:hypothetical protein
MFLVLSPRFPAAMENKVIVSTSPPEFWCDGSRHFVNGDVEHLHEVRAGSDAFATSHDLPNLQWAIDESLRLSRNRSIHHG